MPVDVTPGHRDRGGSYRGGGVTGPARAAIYLGTLAAHRTVPALYRSMIAVHYGVNTKTADTGNHLTDASSISTAWLYRASNSTATLSETPIHTPPPTVKQQSDFRVADLHASDLDFGFNLASPTPPCQNARIVAGFDITHSPVVAS